MEDPLAMFRFRSNEFQNNQSLQTVLIRGQFVEIENCQTTVIVARHTGEP